MDVEIVISDMENVEMFNDVDKIKDFISTLEYIDQPLNTQLSSILQVCCQFAKDDKVVKYLLKQNANPNYLDINGHDCRHYVDLNKNTLAALKCLKVICHYTGMFPEEDPSLRKQVGFDVIKAEIQRHRDKEIEEKERIGKMIKWMTEWVEAEDGK
ncbi:MAG: hypothetical protein J6Y03_01900 [Alphaproteobacteria bacterium]|nr:hypothetical protein [Alphaproteobacteria bacterium]